MGRWRRGHLTYFREVELFEALKAEYPDLTPLSATDRCDAVTHNAFIEIKCRRKHYDRLMIERHKWFYLADIRARTGFRTLYICSTPQGVYEFDLGALNEPEWVLSLLPTKTDFAGSEMTEKPVGFLHIQDSRLLTI